MQFQRPVPWYSSLLVCLVFIRYSKYVKYENMYYIDVIFILINYWLIGNCFLNIYIAFNLYCMSLTSRIVHSYCSLWQSHERVRFSGAVCKGDTSLRQNYIYKEINIVTQLLILCIFSKLCRSSKMFQTIFVILRPSIVIRNENIQSGPRKSSPGP